MTTTPTTQPGFVRDAATANRAAVVQQTILTGLTREQVLERLDQAARRGSLPGFSHGGPGGALFTITDFGSPFESTLRAAAEPANGLTRLSLVCRRKPIGPWVFAVALVLTVWPGVWLTDSLIRTYFSGYTWATWKWYLPLTAPFCPWVFWTAMKRSRVSAEAEMLTMIPSIRTIVDGTPAADAGAAPKPSQAA